MADKDHEQEQKKTVKSSSSVAQASEARTEAERVTDGEHAQSSSNQSTVASDASAADSSVAATDNDVSPEYEGVATSGSPTVKLEDELKQSFIDYAMSVIVDRALPDVRDGLKPVHRRVLYDMYDLKIWHNGPTKKSARVVGDVIGRFHPHGDVAVYDTIVRMAQWFSMRAPLVFGQGNFGNLDGDGAAAMRYTEVRMTKIAEMMLQDIDKETVNTYPNYDGNEQIPEVLPTRYPNLLVNGSAGIAVGLATNIPPHNLAEVIDGTLALLANSQMTLDEMMKYIPGPDFPTGGLIISSPEIKKAYATGRGRCLIRARTHVETDKQGRSTIYVDEIPYMVNKSAIVKEIAELVRDKKIEGIAEVNDLSDKDNQVRIAIDLKRDAYEEAVLNNLYQHTSMQSSFSFNVIALVNNRPKQLSLLEILHEFLKFRREVVTRRTVFLLRQDRRKAFYNEGLIVATSNIERVIAIIKGSANTEEARERLMLEDWNGTPVASVMEFDAHGDNICLPLGVDPQCGLRVHLSAAEAAKAAAAAADAASAAVASDAKANPLARKGQHLTPELVAEAAAGNLPCTYHLSEEQARGILALQLQRLTHLATDEIKADYDVLKQHIHGYLEILNSTERMNEVIRTELLEAKETFRDPRRSTFVNVDGYISKADLVSRQAVIITLSHEGYIKYQDLSLYAATSRGTKGNNAAKLKEEDYIETSTVCNSHDSIMCFTNMGRCFVTKVYDLPTSNNRTWRGRPIQNFFDLQEGEAVRRILPVSEEVENSDESTFIVFATTKGNVKRSDLKVYKGLLARANATGIKAINLVDGDELMAVELSHGEDDILLFSSNGRVLRFCEYYLVGKKTAAGAAGDDDGDAADSDSADSDSSDAADAADAADSIDSDSDNEGEGDDLLSDSDRIAKELSGLQGYLAARKSGSGIRVSGRGSGTIHGIKLVGKGTKLAGMIVVPAAELENEKLNYIMITDQGSGKRGRLISIVGKRHRGSKGISCCSRLAKQEAVVGVISVQEDSDYLVFSNNGSLMRSHVADITVRSRGAGYVRLKRIDDDEHIVSLQEIPPEVVTAIDASAEKRRLEAASVAGEAAAIDSNDVATEATADIAAEDNLDPEELAAEKRSAAADLDFDDDDSSEQQDAGDSSSDDSDDSDDI